MTLLPPTPAQQKRIDKEVPSDPEMRKQDVRALREWLLKQPHLPNHIGSFANCSNHIEDNNMRLHCFKNISLNNNNNMQDIEKYLN